MSRPPSGITGVPCTRFEAACASSGSAFFHAVSAVAAGLYDLVLVTGVEKMTSQATPGSPKSWPGRRLRRRKPGRSHLPCPLRDDCQAPHARVRHNAGAPRRRRRQEPRATGQESRAHLRKLITLEQALAGKPIADPLTVYDCSLVSDGAAAVVWRPSSAPPSSPASRSGSSASPRLPTSAARPKADITTFRRRPRGRRKGLQDGRHLGRRHPIRRTARLLHHRRDHRHRRPRIL